MPPVFNMDLCAACGLCDEVCPVDAIHFIQDKDAPSLKYPDECWHCGACRQDCPEGAISIVFPPDMLCM